MDLVSNMLSTLRLNADIFLHSSFCNEWVIDLQGNRLFKNTYGSLPSYFRNRSRVYTGGQIDGGRCGFIDQDGSLVIPLIYMDGLHFWHPVTNVSGNKSDFCIDVDGNVLLEVSHSNYRIQAVCDSRVIILDEDEDRFGVLDMDGRVIVPLYYQSAASFGYKEGLLNVSDENDKYGYIDRSGKLVIECKFDFARPFEGGVGEIFLDKPEGTFEGLIRPDGEFLLAPKYKYETVRYRGGSVWSAETYEGREILINETGKVIWDSDTA